MQGVGGRESVVGVDAAKDVLNRLTQDPRAADLEITITWDTGEA